MINEFGTSEKLRRLLAAYAQQFPANDAVLDQLSSATGLCAKTIDQLISAAGEPNAPDYSLQDPAKCNHEIDWSQTYRSPDVDIYIDVQCVKCGLTGTLGTEEHVLEGIDWDEPEPAKPTASDIPAQPQVTLLKQRLVDATVNEEVEYQADQADFDDALAETGNVLEAMNQLIELGKAERVRYDTQIDSVHEEHDETAKIKLP
ncbi:hypothetical protein [Ferrimonas marina]|uniref:Uncharacterized protein n=1 Tax=Ferrimonas marina TaxID=299255 RepID=A0A1M5TW09_9GAMM|nr:hypothetical protein [Ferrimonas marina]SHH54982.1 hypothetical protein SAMN02745129_2301 [Ferrimonas marina]